MSDLRVGCAEQPGSYDCLTVGRRTSRGSIRLLAVALTVFVGPFVSLDVAGAGSAIHNTAMYDYDTSAEVATGDVAAPDVAATISGSRGGVLGPPVESIGVHLRPSPDFVAPSGLGDDFANYGGEFLDDATRFPMTRLDTPAGTFDVPPHAANRMAGRGITSTNVQDALATQPFDYFHDGVWKVGYYDSGTRVFVGTVGDTITTTIKTGPNYIRNLQALTP